MKIQRIQQLETLLQEYKTTNQLLSKEINDLGGDSTSLGHGQSREALSAEIEKERLEKLDAHKGQPVPCYVDFLETYDTRFQLSKK